MQCLLRPTNDRTGVKAQNGAKGEERKSSPRRGKSLRERDDRVTCLCLPSVGGGVAGLAVHFAWAVCVPPVCMPFRSTFFGALEVAPRLDRRSFARVPQGNNPTSVASGDLIFLICESRPAGVPSVRPLNLQ